MDIYPRGTTPREKQLINMMAIAAFLILLITGTAFAINTVTLEFLVWVVALLFLVIISLELIVLKILIRNTGWR
jgi:hypothetical protein